MVPKVSVIVPVYNAEKYLDQCIESILSQTLKDLELILVDDCSTDNSRSTMLKYKGDSRVKTILLDKNGGVSAARNIALRASTGEYISFVDSDDFIAIDMYEKMLKYDADIVSCGIIKCDDNNSILSKIPYPLKSMATSNEIRAALVTAHKSRAILFSSRNIFKRSLIIDNGIAFDEDMRIGEDSIFNMYCYNNAKNISVVDEAFYYYRENPNSLTSVNGNPFLVSSLTAQYEKKIEFYKSYGYGKDALNDLSDYVMVSQLPRLLKNSRYTGSNYKSVFALPFIKEMLKRTALINPKFPRGVQLIIVLGKLRQYKLLKLLLKH